MIISILVSHSQAPASFIMHARLHTASDRVFNAVPRQLECSGQTVYQSDQNHWHLSWKVKKQNTQSSAETPEGGACDILGMSYSGEDEGRVGFMFQQHCLSLSLSSRVKLRP